MTGDVDRRRFLKSTAALAALTALRPPSSFAANAPRIAVPFSRLPAQRTILERFEFARGAGFSGIEMPSFDDAAQIDEVRAAAVRSGLRVHSVVDAASRCSPLSSADAAVVRQGVAGVAASLRTARIWGAGAVMIAPALAAPDTSYEDAWRRSQTVIREQILPLAHDLRVVVAIEEVCAGFVPGPSEVARYVDAFGSRWVKASFDVSRIPFYTTPQDWIHALGRRLVHVRANVVHLSEIAYSGWVIADRVADDLRRRPY